MSHGDAISLLRRLMSVRFPDDAEYVAELNECIADAVSLLGEQVVWDTLHETDDIRQQREKLIDLVEGRVDR